MLGREEASQFFQESTGEHGADFRLRNAGAGVDHIRRVELRLFEGRGSIAIREVGDLDEHLFFQNGGDAGFDVGAVPDLLDFAEYESGVAAGGAVSDCCGNCVGGFLVFDEMDLAVILAETAD